MFEILLLAFYPLSLNIQCLLKFKYSEQENTLKSKDLREESATPKVLRWEWPCGNSAGLEQEGKGIEGMDGRNQG